MVVIFPLGHNLGLLSPKFAIAKRHELLFLLSSDGFKVLLNQVLVLGIQRLKFVWACIVVENKAEVVFFFIDLFGLGPLGLLFGDDGGTPSSVEFPTGIPFNTLGFDFRWNDLQLS